LRVEPFRIDSEFQLKEYTDSIKFITNKKHQKFDDLISLLTDGKHGGVSLTENGVVFLRTTNIKENEIDTTDLRFISEKESEETLRAEFKENDLLLTTIGTVGLCAKVPKDFPRATINQNLVRIVLDDIDKSSFLCCFLNSKYGKNQLLRYSAGNVYQMINYPNIRKILIPIFNKTFYLRINELYILCDKKREESKSAYTQAEIILMREMGLQPYNHETVENIQYYLNEDQQTYTIDNVLNGDQPIEPSVLDEADFWSNKLEELQNPENYKPENYLEKEQVENEIKKVIERLKFTIKAKTAFLDMAKEHNQAWANINQLREAQKQNINIKSFKDSFGTTGRLDAEYYQKKYDVLENVFNKNKRIKLYDLVNYPISSGITPKAGGDDYTDFENGVPFVRAVDLQNGEVSTSNFNFIKPIIHNTILKRTQLKKGDVLLSIAGTVGRSALFNHSIEANINQAVAILRFDEKEVLRLYLVAFFNSYVGKEFISKYSRQGVQTNLNLSEIGDLSVPIIDYKKQQEIAFLIEDSFSLKKQSEHLLEVAKRAVEIAIEENETVAMGYINENVKKL